MKHLAVLLILVLLLAVQPSAALAQQPTPPPTPTLAPVVGASTSATQTLQLQDFARRESYLLEASTVYTTTSSGAVWVVERRYTYGEAGITIVVMALALVQAFDLLYRIVTRER